MKKFKIYWDSIMWNKQDKCFMFIQECYCYDDVDIYVSYLKHNKSYLTYDEAKDGGLDNDDKVFAVPSFVGNFINWINEKRHFEY